MSYIDTLKNLSQYIHTIQSYGENKNFTEAVALAKEALEKYPSSTELHHLYLTYLQLIQEESPYWDELTLEEIKNYYLLLSKVSSEGKIDYNIDTLAYMHNIFDEKSPTMDELFSQSFSLLMFYLKDFLGIYFSYLTETDRDKEIHTTIEKLQYAITHIPTSLLEDGDYYGHSKNQVP